MRRAIALLLAIALGAPAILGAQEQENQIPSEGTGQAQAPGAAGSASIEFPHVPRLSVTALPTYGTAPLIVGFFVSNRNPQSGPFVSYRWSFGDGTISTLPPTLFFHTFKKPGSYVIEVTGTTSDGLNSTGVTGVVVRAGR